MDNIEKITLSIYVPCFNEENNITNTLNKIKEAAQHISYEVIVVDDGSEDKTMEMIEKFNKDNPNANCQFYRRPTYYDWMDGGDSAEKHYGNRTEQSIFYKTLDRIMFVLK